MPTPGGVPPRLGRNCVNMTAVPQALVQSLGLPVDVQLQCARRAGGHDDHIAFVLNHTIRWTDEAWPLS